MAGALESRGWVSKDGRRVGHQSRLVSLIESVCNVGSGFLLSLLLWQFVIAPMFGYEVTMVTNLAITSMFTVVSVIRGYLWRRFFNAELHRALARMFRK